MSTAFRNLCEQFRATIAACQSQGVRIEHPKPPSLSWHTRYHKALNAGKAEAKAFPERADKFITHKEAK